MDRSQTIPVLLDEAARRWGPRPALRFFDGTHWPALSWTDYHERVQALAASFVDLGLEPGRGVSILASDAPEWFIANLAAIVAGGIPTGHYVTNSPEQIRYIADHSRSQIIVVDSEEQLRKVEQVRGSLSEVKALVATRAEARDGVLGWEELLDAGRRSASRDLVRQRSAAQTPGDVATLIYTSGTTGDPKAVMLTHRNIAWTANAIVETLGMTSDDRLVSYLPLSHIAEQIFSHHAPVQSGACTAFAADPEMLADTLRYIRPTLFLGVPRVWEKIQAKIEEIGAQNPPLRRRISAWARKVGLEGGRADQDARPRPWSWRFADRLVFHKVKEKLGLDQARMCFTSAAPAARSTLEFFLSLGIPIYEVYGMSECTGPTTFSLPGSFRIGAVGKAAPGTDLAVGDDDEVLMRGPHVFPGYYRDEEATARTIDADGWLHSGDLGEIDAEGFLTITGRRKDLIITSGGHNIAPQNIEQALKAIPPIAQAVVLGDRRSFLIALLTLDDGKIPVVAREIGSPATDVESAAGCSRFRSYLEERIDGLGARFARSEVPKRFSILPSELSIAGGELTPTMKVRRNVVQEKYAGLIEELYAASHGRSGG
ncbi:MAG: AMP-binding protein, partial [Acidobacteria bacterium]|nr:AMP-binding protein [Acidobacteriota bacterium]